MLKKILERAWPISLCILLSMIFVWINYVLSGTWLDLLLGENLFWIMAAIMWLTLTSMTFFMSKLIDLEEKFWQEFSKTRKEIKDNLLLSFFSVIVCLLLIIVSSDGYCICWQLIIKVLSLSTLLLQLLAFWEICFALVWFKWLIHKKK